MGGTESKPTLVEIAYEKIRNKICDFELYPGQDVSDFTLCKELGMSRTPVRQALVQLEHDGLVKNAGIGKSYQVSEITEEEIADIFFKRAVRPDSNTEAGYDEGAFRRRDQMFGTDQPEYGAAK